MSKPKSTAKGGSIGGKVAGAAAGKAKKALGGKATNNEINKDTPNLWVRRGDGKPITVDVYNGVKSSDPLTSGGDAGGKFSNTFDLGLAKYVAKGAGYLNTIRKGIGFVSKAQSIFKGQGSLLDKVVGITGMSKDAASLLNISPDSTLYKNIMEGANVITKGSQFVGRAAKTDWKNLDSIAGFANSLSKDNELFKIKDLGASAQLFAGVVNEMTKNGFPDSFSKIAGAIGDSTVINGMLKEVLPVTMAMSDIKNLKGIADYIKGPEMNSLFPGVVKSFSKQYDKKWFSEKDQHNVLVYKEITAVYDKINPDWYHTQRGEDKIFSLEEVIGGSKTFKNIFIIGSQMAQSSDDKKMMALLNVFKESPVMVTLNKDFPKTHVKNNSISINNVNSDLIF